MVVLAASPPLRTPATSREPTPAPLSFGRFELIERIGMGGMAEVFRAQVRGPEGFRRELVVKRVLPHLSVRARFTQMFVNEAKISALLNHPNIVQIFEFGESDGCYFIAMESVRGLTLREVLTKLRARDAVMPVVAALEIAREILVALDYAHNLRDVGGRPLDIVHRDISPSNVMLADNGAVKVLDFGIARAADLMEENDSQIVKGKVAYLAPEQIALAGVDARVDLFALGCVLFEALTGRLLFRTHNDLQKKVALLAQPSPAPSAFNFEVPPAVDAIVRKAVERAPEARYESAADMLLDVENYLSSFRSANRAVLRLVRSLAEPAEASLSSSHGSASHSAQRSPGGDRSGATAATSPLAARAPSLSTRADTGAKSGTKTGTKTGPIHPHPAPGVPRDTSTRTPPHRLAGAGHAERVRVDRLKHHRRWGGLAVGLLVVAGLAGLGLGGRALLAQLARGRAPAAESAPRAAAPPTFVLVTFLSHPSEAQILDARSNRWLGKTPATLPVTEAQAKTRFRFEKPGFLPVTVEAIPDADKTLEVVLRPAPPGGKTSRASKAAARPANAPSPVTPPPVPPSLP